MIGLDCFDIKLSNRALLFRLDIVRGGYKSEEN